MNKADEAVAALREAARAYRELPDVFKSVSALFGGSFLKPESLELEADKIEARVVAFKEAMKDG